MGRPGWGVGRGAVKRSRGQRHNVRHNQTCRRMHLPPPPPYISANNNTVRCRLPCVRESRREGVGARDEEELVQKIGTLWKIVSRQLHLLITPTGIYTHKHTLSFSLPLTYPLLHTNLTQTQTLTTIQKRCWKILFSRFYSHDSAQWSTYCRVTYNTKVSISWTESHQSQFIKKNSNRLQQKQTQMQIIRTHTQTEDL